MSGVDILSVEVNGKLLAPDELFHQVFFVVSFLPEEQRIYCCSVQDISNQRSFSF